MSREQFEDTAKATSVAINKAHGTADKAISKLIGTYADQGEHIRLSGLSANGWAWLAEHTADEEDTAKAIAKEDGKRAQPTRLNTYQRALNIAKRVAESGKTCAELVEEYRATLDGDEVTLTGFANWCVSDGNRREPRSTPKSWKMYLSEAINKAQVDGASVEEIMAEINNLLG